MAVVLPMRNAAPWLPALLAALVREWVVPFELIAVDDASSDGSGALLERLCSHWPRHRWRLLQGEGRGVSAARNQAVAATQAPLIAFLDADDRPLPGRLAQPLAVLKSHPQLHHVHSGWWRADAAGHCLHPVQPWQEGAGFDWRAALEHKAVLPSAWTIRREAFLAVGGFDAHLSHAEDVDLMVRLAAAGFQGAWIPELLVRYRVHGASASARLRAHADGLLEVLRRHTAELPPAEQAWTRQLRYDTTTWCCWHAWNAGATALALQLLRDALTDCPYPLPRRPVHLLEVFHRSASRVGQSWDRQALMQSPFWREAEQLLLDPVGADGR